MNIRSLTSVYVDIEAQKPYICSVCVDQDFSLCGQQYYENGETIIEIFCEQCDSKRCVSVDNFSYVTHSCIDKGRRICVYTFYNCDLSKNPDNAFMEDDDGMGLYYFHAIRQEPVLPLDIN